MGPLHDALGGNLWGTLSHFLGKEKFSIDKPAKKGYEYYRFGLIIYHLKSGE